MASDARSKKMYALRDIAKIKVDKKSPLAVTSPAKNVTTSSAKSPAKVSHKNIPVILVNNKPIDDPQVPQHLVNLLPTNVHKDELMTVEEREQRVTEIINRVMAYEEKEMLKQSNWAPSLDFNQDRRARIPVGQPSFFMKDLAVIMNTQKMQNLIDQQEKQCLELIKSKKTVPNLGEYRLNFSNQYREQPRRGSLNILYNIQLDSIVTSHLQSHLFPRRVFSPPRGRQ